MSGGKSLFRKGARYLKRWIMQPHRVTETLLRVRRMELLLENLPQPVAAAAPQPALASPLAIPAALPPPVPGEVYSGYSAADMWLFDLFGHANPSPSPGFVTDFIGTKTRTSSLWKEVRSLDNQVMGRPVPYDLFEAVEWVGLLKAVVSARDGRFAVMELGAGWGPWLAAGATAARLRNLHDLRLVGIEADPGRFELMRQHFIDNGLDPAAHRLICAAVGVERGVARWPRISDPANAGGARPVQEIAGKLDQSDSAYMRGAIDDFITVETVPLGELLAREPVWDLVHIDIQGWEAKLCAATIGALTERARWVIVGTHSRPIDGQLIEIFFDAGWILENEKPTRFAFDPSKSSVESMAEVDGAQVWRNPRLCDPVAAQ